jgi:hypothetical protein
MRRSLARSVSLTCTSGSACAICSIHCFIRSDVLTRIRVVGAIKRFLLLFDLDCGLLASVLHLRQRGLRFVVALASLRDYLHLIADAVEKDLHALNGGRGEL